MKRAFVMAASRRVALVVAALVSLAAFAAPPEAPTPKTPPSGPPPGPPPPYQVRAPLPDGDRLVGGKDGAVLFSNRCGACHLPGGMGTNMLTKQRLMMGESPEKALLENRSDLTQGYVRVVVRAGRGAMPLLSRVEVTDAELDAIASYLGKAGP